MSNFFSKGNVRNYVAADVALNTDFAFINFDLSDAAETHIYNIESNLIVDAVDQPNLRFIFVRIFRNITLNNDLGLGVQLGQGGAQTFWEGKTKRIGDENLSRVFHSPFILDKSFRYCAIAFATFSAAIAVSVSISLFINGRINVSQENELQFKTR